MSLAGDLRKTMDIGWECKQTTSHPPPPPPALHQHYKASSPCCDTKGLPAQDKILLTDMTDFVVYLPIAVALSDVSEEKADHRPEHPPLPDSRAKRRLWQCLKCNFTTPFRTSVLNHQRTHTGERPHKCGLCSKAFTRKSSLVVHFRNHTGERPFRCELCPMGFTQKRILEAHIRTHTGEKPFKCRFCPKVFTHKWQMSKHERMHPGCVPSANALSQYSIGLG
ncbi:hypothetical protein HPB50_005531 [Hyalomma asiaticum]|uniref:Uncharacterized protein n=1 Tax=Hyalomma asiaticum TaxID=266040 RepID=A0ACB7RMY4_HYAAI|nr:hypothetical protein HPB50_005531 [Hyalomma asiaticum]